MNSYKKNSVLLILPAEEFNESEYQVFVDRCREANVKTFICSDSVNLCIGKNGKRVKNDILLANANAGSFGGCLIVGGQGIMRYIGNRSLHKLLASFINSGKPIGAICLAPAVLFSTGLLKGGSGTVHPDGEKYLQQFGGILKNSRVVMHNNIVTGRDPESAFELAATFITLLTTTTIGRFS